MLKQCNSWTPQSRPRPPQASRKLLATPRCQAAAIQDAPRQIPETLADIPHRISGYGAELASDHPGFHDHKYKERRIMLARLADQYEHGQPIPRVDYTATETECWGKVLAELRELYPTHACKEFLELFDEYGFQESKVAQLQDVSNIMRSHTGFIIHPVSGMLHPRDFLNALAFKIFHATQYIRHSAEPTYSPEPDTIHDLIDLVHTIGVASLAADDKQIWHLVKLYYHTVEFGVVKEAEEIKAFGAGVLSSYGELKHMRSGEPKFEPLDVFAKQPKMSYNEGFQKRYFVLDSFEGGAKELHRYCASITPPELLDKFFKN